MKVAALSMALAILAAACSLVDPPPPPGTHMVEAQVKSEWPQAISPVLKTPAGEIEHAIQPATLQPRSMTNVRFYVPITGQWTIAFNPGVEIPSRDFDGLAKVGCTPIIVIGDDGSYAYGCGQ